MTCIGLKMRGEEEDSRWHHVTVTPNPTSLTLWHDDILFSLLKEIVVYESYRGRRQTESTRVIPKYSEGYNRDFTTHTD